jgi:hypothetical protein
MTGYLTIRGDGVFFDSENQFLSDIHLPPRLDADAHVGDGFADDPARHWDTALTDNDKKNRRFTEPGRIDGRNIIRFLSYHLDHCIEYKNLTSLR